MNTNLHYVLGLFLFFLTFSMSGQNNYWTETSESNLTDLEKARRSSTPKDYSLYHLDIEAFKTALENAPERGSLNGQAPVVISFPISDGHFEKFNVVSSSILEGELQEKYSNIRTYKATGIDDPTATMRFSVTQFGVHTISLSGKRNAEYIDPFTIDGENYIVYNRKDLTNSSQNFECLTDDVKLPSLEGNATNRMLDADDSTHRTYRLALSCNAEYGNLFATLGNEVEAIQAQMTLTINRVNEIYERDLSITLIFVENNDELIYFGNTSQDPWSGEYINTTQQVNDNTIGDANYDIGHNFNTSGGGQAGCIGCVCQSGIKGGAFTGSLNPTGDAFDIDYVAHEMGHQFGGYHTMNTCSRSGDGTTEVEPASGSSIMGYAGICPVNVQSNSDAHFNYVTVRDITNNIKNGVSSSCPEEFAITNQAPVADAGEDYTIPASTAFVLEGSATDQDGTESLTYNWSQNDTEQAPGTGSPQPTWEVGPLYRSILPLDSPQRYLPNLQDVLDGDLTPTWEVTPSVSREMNFSFIVRDNGSGFSDGIGQTDSDLMTVTVNDQAGPFTVTSQNDGNTIWYEGESRQITWDVANTNTAPINATNVDIYLSTNAGQTFETTLASNVPNNGSATITVPLGTSTNNARLMVKASENIFYAVNQEEFNIETSSFFFAVDNLSNGACAPNTAEYSFTYNTNNSFSGSTDFSAENLPAGLTATFNPSSASSNDTEVTLTITGTENVDFGTYEFDLTGNSGTESFSTTLSLGVFDSSLETPDLLTPNNGQTGVNQNPVLTWEELSNANTYQLQIASDEQFTAIVVDTELEANTYPFTSSQLNTTYFWRVKAINPCSETEFSNFFEFQISDCSVCPSEGNLDFNTGTTLVNFNTINNPTPSNKENAYNDFTDISTQVVIGETYDMTININTDGNYICGTLVWIDWNQNCSFDDPGEEYDLGAALNVADGITNNSPLGITVPDDAALGETIMRVSTRYEVYPEACGIDFDGEVEDYTVIVTDELSTSSNELADSFAIYPNPNQGEFTVSLRSENPSPIDINVFDITGRRIFNQSYEYQHDFSQNLRLNQAQAGVYFVKVSNGNNNVTKKVIVE